MERTTWKEKVSGKRRRKPMQMETPNPLFKKWITEWRNKAREENSKMEFCFKRALSTLSMYPLPLEHGRDCKILKGFGDKICRMLDEKLKEHKKNGCSLDDIVAETSYQEENNEQDSKKITLETDQPTKRKSLSKEYIPKEGTGSFAILVTLYKKSLEPLYPGYLSKLELIREAQHLSNTSFTRPDPGSRYTAWSSMRTLISKNLVMKKSHPPKFSLTDMGLLLASRLYDTEFNKNVSNISSNTIHDVQCVQEDIESLDHELIMAKKQKLDTNARISFESSTQENVVSQTSNNKIIQRYGSSSSTNSSIEKDLTKSWHEEVTGKMSVASTSSKTIQKYTSSSSIATSTQSLPEETMIFLPNTFDIILYVDTNETGGSNVDIRDDPILAELTFLATPHEVKKLKVGDYTWICRDKTTGTELVLPYIIERKRMDDLGKSIKDGRYHEQKFRLKKSGIQNVTYLIESHGNNEHVGVPIATLLQAATNTAVQDGFCVKFTKNYKGTAKYLANFSSLLINIFRSKTIVSCPKENLVEINLDDDLISLMTFKEFNNSSAKNKHMKVSDMFVKMLMQIKGMSVDKALAIVREYPTPDTLRKAYEENPGMKGAKLLEQIRIADSMKTIGQTLSKIVYQLFTMELFVNMNS